MKGVIVNPLDKKWISNKEAAKYLGVSPGFLQNLRDEARISFYKVGRNIFYKVAEIDRLIEKGRII